MGTYHATTSTLQINLKANEYDVYEFFSRAGKVCCLPCSVLLILQLCLLTTHNFPLPQVRDVRLIMDRNSRRSKGVGYANWGMRFAAMDCCRLCLHERTMFCADTLSFMTSCLFQWLSPCLVSFCLDSL